MYPLYSITGSSDNDIALLQYSFPIASKELSYNINFLSNNPFDSGKIVNYKIISNPFDNAILYDSTTNSIWSGQLVLVAGWGANAKIKF